MAGLDLMTGHVHRVVVERHRSREFVAFLQQLDGAYPAGARIRLGQPFGTCPKETPHRISLRLAARLLRLPLKGGSDLE